MTWQNLERMLAWMQKVMANLVYGWGISGDTPFAKQEDDLAYPKTLKSVKVYVQQCVVYRGGALRDQELCLRHRLFRSCREFSEIFPDAEMKKRKIKILFAGINDKMEEKDEDEDEKDKKTSKHPDAANEKKDVKGKKNDEKEKKGREPSRPKYDKHSGLKEKLPKALDSAKPDQKVSGESVAMEQAEPKKKDKDKFTEKAEKTSTKNGKEPEEKLDGIKPSEKALTGKDAKEQSQPKKDTEHLEKDKKEDKEEDVEQQHEAKMTGKPEIIVHKVEIDSDFTQKPEPVEHESGEGKDKEMDERDAAHPHHGAEAEKKILVVTMFRDQKVPEEALSRSGDEDDEDEEEENPDADEAKASKPNM
uniref:Glutamic acid-rich protein-like n=1 Tax=Angiostrongylus cantonensis TaxID=6313 RepID=A0A0K0CT42_ANGCA